MSGVSGKAISGKKILILATNGYEQSELEVPLNELRKAGATVDVVAPHTGEITGWLSKNWGRSVPVDKPLAAVKAEDYDAIVLPGGQMNPDILRVNPEAVALVKAFYDQKKTVAAICHAPWLLIEADVVRGRKVTSYKSVKTDLVNAGALWEDSDVVVDQGLVTARQPDDLPAFVAKIIEEVGEGRHERRAA
jgi:protease I